MAICHPFIVRKYETTLPVHLCVYKLLKLNLHALLVLVPRAGFPMSARSVLTLS